MYGYWYAAQAMRRVGPEAAATWYRAAADDLCKLQQDDGSWREHDSTLLGTTLGCLTLASPVFDTAKK